MKLKKIASLALAGVMAVSMLAGCNGNTKPVDPEVPVEPAASISAEVGALLDAPKYVTFENDTKLDSALKTAAEYAGVLDVMPQYVLADELVDVDLAIYDKLGIETTSRMTIENLGSQWALKAAELSSKDGYTVEDATVTAMWAISTAIDENAVKAQIAEMLEDVEDYNYAVVENGNVVGGNFNFEYTVSVSTYEKAVNSTGVGGVVGGIDSGWTGIHGGIVGGGVSAADPAVTFVAVQIVRTATHQ